MAHLPCVPWPPPWKTTRSSPRFGRSPCTRRSPAAWPFTPCVWWFDWQHTVNKRLIGEGTHNKAFLVTGADLPPDELFTVGYGLPVPDRGMIVRTGMVRTTGPDRKAPPNQGGAHQGDGHGCVRARPRVWSPRSMPNSTLAPRGDVQTLSSGRRRRPAPGTRRWPHFVPPGPTGGADWRDRRPPSPARLRRRGKATARTRSAASPSTPTTNSIRTCLQRSLSPCVRARPTRASGTWTSSAPTCSTARPPTGRSSSALPTLTAISVASWRPNSARLRGTAASPPLRRAFSARFGAWSRARRGFGSRGPIREAMKTEAGVDLDAITPAEWCFFLKTEQETKEVTRDDGTHPCASAS